jgi:hypothetical protein
VDDLEPPRIENRRTGTKSLHELTKRDSSIVPIAKFAFAVGIGFLDAEVLLVTGSYLLYNTPSVPQTIFSIPTYWVLIAFAFLTGVTAAFFVNEGLLANDVGFKKIDHKIQSVLGRLGKFQLVFLAGIFGVLWIKWLLLKEMSYPPMAGYVVGAIVFLPLCYVLTARFVWKVNGQVSPSRTIKKKFNARYIKRVRLQNISEILSQKTFRKATLSVQNPPSHFLPVSPKMPKLRRSKTQVAEPDDMEDFEAKPVQTLRIVGHTVNCKNCSKELAMFYCPCGAFLCAFDMISHKCLVTLRQNISDELKRALR